MKESLEGRYITNQCCIVKWRIFKWRYYIKNIGKLERRVNSSFPVNGFKYVFSKVGKIIEIRLSHPNKKIWERRRTENQKIFAKTFIHRKIKKKILPAISHMKKPHLRIALSYNK